MENFYSAPTPLTSQVDSLVFNTNPTSSLEQSLFILPSALDNNASINFNSINEFNAHDHHHGFNYNFETTEYLSPCFEYLVPINSIHSNQTFELNTETCDLDLNDSLKKVLDEIESFSSVFLEESSPSPSSEFSIYPDQELLSPSFDLNLEINSDLGQLIENFDLPELDKKIESASSSSGESEEILSDDSVKGLKKVKSGRVNKRESNKVAAVRYRQKKNKERDVLFQECDIYEQKNHVLRDQIKDIDQEIGFIKNLLFQALHNKA